MSSFLNFLKSLLPHVKSQQERDESYLAQAVDMNDLERRLRDIDMRGRHKFQSGAAIGLYVR